MSRSSIVTISDHEGNSSSSQLKAMANVEDHVVPVRLDLEHDHWRLKDTFAWNCSGQSLPLPSVRD